DLHGADLCQANLATAFIDRANLRGADLSWARLQNAVLNGAILNEVSLHGANLTGVHFGDAALSQAIVGWTIFGNVDLSRVKGLETVRHNGPSTIGIDTIYLSQGNIPEVFLKGAGVDDTFITYIHS